ncbi:hypothetical protein WDU94_011742 [Cyamophila willieti]
MELNHLEDEELDIIDVLQEQDIWLENFETDAWLLPGPMLDEGEQLRRSLTIGSNTIVRKQIASSKLSGPDSKRGARFKTQVIKYEEPQSLGGGDDDLDLEPPPSLSSLDDYNFVPDKFTTQNSTHVQNSRVNGLDATFSASPPALDASFIVSHGGAGNPFDAASADPFDVLPDAMTSTYNVKTSGALDAKSSALDSKTAYLDKIKAVRQKYATPKGAKTISQVSESEEVEFLSNTFSNKLSLVNQKLDEIKPDEGRRLSSSGKFLLNSPELGSPSSPLIVPNRLSLGSASTKPNRLSLGSPSTVPNRLSLGSPIGANRTLTLINQKLEDDLLADNKLSRMNENLFVATSPSPMVENKRFILPNVSATSSTVAFSKETATAATNFTSPSEPKPKSSAIPSSATNSENVDPAVIPPKPKLKKQGTFEILDDNNDENAGGGNEDENRYQTMVLPCVDAEGVTVNQNSEEKESPFAVPLSSTPKSSKAISKQQQMTNSYTITKSSIPSSVYQDHGLNTSFTIEKHEDFDDVTNVKALIDNTSAKSYLTMTYLEDDGSSKTSVSSTRLNSSLTYSRESKSSSNSRSNTSVTYLNGADPNEDLINQNIAQSTFSQNSQNGLNTSYSKLSNESPHNVNKVNVNRSYLSNDLNRSYTVSTEMTEDESNEEFNATEAESNEEYRVTEAHRNMLNKSFTLLNALENAVEESKQLNNPKADLNENGDVFGEGLNTSFTVKKHFEETVTYSDQNGLDSNDINDNLYGNSVYRKNMNENLVNGKSRGNAAPTGATSKTDYRTFTRRGKIPTGPGTYRNGTSGLLQKKTLVRPSAGYGVTGANMNSTFTPPESDLNETRTTMNETRTLNLNETVQISANNASRYGPSRFSTVTRSKDNSSVKHNPSVQDNAPPENPNETVNINRFSTITRPKSKLSYVGQKQTGNRLSTVINVSSGTTGVARCKNSSSTESLKSNESYVISRPNGLAPRTTIPKRSIHKSTGALNVGGAQLANYSRVQSTDNLSVKSGGSDSDGSSVGGSSALPRPSGLVRPGFSRIPAPPSSRIPATAKTSMLRPTSMLNKYSATRKV